MDMMFACGTTQNSCKAASYGTSLYYIHNDHLGTPKLMTNNLGAIVWNATATPFGKATVNNDYDGDGNTVTLNIRQPGQYYDKETGLYYNWHRYYDPTTGRYVTSDPIGLRGGINTYTYVYNNPLRYTDSSGLCPLCVGGAVVVVAAAVVAGSNFWDTAADAMMRQDANNAASDEYFNNGGNNPDFDQMKTDQWKGLKETYFDAAEFKGSIDNIKKYQTLMDIKKKAESCAK